MKQTKKAMVWLAVFWVVGSIPVFGKPFAQGLARNSLAFWMPNCTPSLTASQSRNPRHRMAMPVVSLNRAQPNLRHTWTPKHLTSFWPTPKGPYLGQTPPGPVAQVFAPGLICDTRPHQWEAWPSFSADGNTFCFNRRRYVYITEKTDQGWTAPKRIESIPYYSVSCCLSPDANSIYIKCVPFSKAKQRGMPWVKGWCMRRCIRTSQGWSLPQELGPPFSSLLGGFSVAADNSIYFVELGKGHCIAPFVGNTWPRTVKIPVEQGNLKACHPGIAPDGSFMVFYSIRPGAPGGTETDLYLTLRRPDGSWTELRNMGPRINTRYFEWGARISPDKKYMFFTRSTGWDLNSSSDTSDIYWVELKEYLPESYR